MNEPSDYDGLPLHFEPAPIGALASKSHALQDAYRTIEELQERVADLQRQNAEVRRRLASLGAEEDDE